MKHDGHDVIRAEHRFWYCRTCGEPFPVEPRPPDDPTPPPPEQTAPPLAQERLL